MGGPSFAKLRRTSRRPPLQLNAIRSSATLRAMNFAWITVCGNREPELSGEVESRVLQRIEKKEFTSDNVYYVSKVDLRPVKGQLDISDSELEKLRAMCSLWSIELRPAAITSHRKLIGPLIVAAKRLIFPIVRVFMRDALRQQSSFNAATIALMAELATAKRSDCSETSEK